MGIFTNLLNFYIPHFPQHCDGNNTNIYETNFYLSKRKYIKLIDSWEFEEKVVYVIKYYFIITIKVWRSSLFTEGEAKNPGTFVNFFIQIVLLFLRV